MASLNARWDEWNDLSEDEYEMHKKRICEECIASLETFIPDVRSKIDHVEAATPRTVNYYTKSMQIVHLEPNLRDLKYLWICLIKWLVCTMLARLVLLCLDGSAR